ncbi:hypothetical protein [Thermaerobacter litoralis]
MQDPAVQPVPFEDFVGKAMHAGGLLLAEFRNVLPLATVALAAFGFLLLLWPRRWNSQFRWIGVTALFSAAFLYTFVIAAVPLVIYVLRIRGVTAAPLP